MKLTYIKNNLVLGLIVAALLGVWQGCKKEELVTVKYTVTGSQSNGVYDIEYHTENGKKNKVDDHPGDWEFEKKMEKDNRFVLKASHGKNAPAANELFIAIYIDGLRVDDDEIKPGDGKTEAIAVYN